MNLLWILVIVLVILAVVGNPHVGTGLYPGYSYGYWPSGLGLILAVILILFLFGRP